MSTSNKAKKANATTTTDITKMTKAQLLAYIAQQQEKAQQQKQANEDLAIALQESKKEIVELKTSVKGTSSRNTSSSSMSINTYRAMWLLIQARAKLLFYVDNKAMMSSSVFYRGDVDTTKELFDTEICEDLKHSRNKGFWKYSTDFGKSGEQLGSLHNFGLAFLGFEGKLSKKTGITIEIFEESSFSKYNKKGDIVYDNIATRRERVIAFLRDDEKCNDIEQIKKFCSMIKNPIKEEQEEQK